MNMKSFMPLTDLHSQIYSVTFSLISVCTKCLWCYLLQARINYKQHLELSRMHAAKYIEVKKRRCQFDKSAKKYANRSSMSSDVQPIINYVSRLLVITVFF